MICAKYLVIFAIAMSGAFARNNWESNMEREGKNAAGNMLVEVAKELVQRSASTSQVIFILNKNQIFYYFLIISYY